MPFELADYRLDPSVNYGFTALRAKSTRGLPEWDKYRLRKIAEIFETCDSVIDFGGATRGLTELLSDRVKGEITTADIDPETSPGIVADICDLPLEDSSVDGIICASILEHVYNPFLAVSEMHRVLKPGGKMFVYVPWMYPYHAGGSFEDYYRFSVDGIKYLFRDFASIDICPVRGRVETIMNFVPMVNKRSMFLRLFGSLLRKIDRKGGAHASGYQFYLVK